MYMSLYLILKIQFVHFAIISIYENFHYNQVNENCWNVDIESL